MSALQNWLTKSYSSFLVFPVKYSWTGRNRKPAKRVLVAEHNLPTPLSLDPSVQVEVFAFKSALNLNHWVVFKLEKLSLVLGSFLSLLSNRLLLCLFCDRTVCGRTGLEPFVLSDLPSCALSSPSAAARRIRLLC